MGAIDIGIEQADRQRFDLARCLERLEIFLERLHIERADYVALGVDALIRFYCQLERRHERCLDIADPAAETARTERARHLQHLPVALGGNEPDPGALSRQDGVGRNRSPVHDLVDLCRINVRLVADAVDTVQDANR